MKKLGFWGAILALLYIPVGVIMALARDYGGSNHRSRRGRRR